MLFELINTVMAIPLAHAQRAEDVPAQTAGQLESLVTFIIGQVPLWITGVIVIIISFILAKLVQGSVENKMARAGFEEEHHEIQVVIGRVSNVGVIIVGTTIGLKIAGIDLTAVIAAGAFGIGFALQDIIMNFIAGVMILASRHYSIGDNIKVNGIIGKIIEIQTRATIVKNFDGTRVIVPNAELFKNPVTSYTSNPFRRVQVGVGVEYASNLKKTVEACMKAAQETKYVLIEPKPSVWVYEFGESSINLKVNMWIESRKSIVKAKTDLVMNIHKELAAVGIGIPFPIRTIVFDEDAKKAKSEAGNIPEEVKVDMVVGEKETIDQKPVEGTAEVSQPDAPQWLKQAAESVIPGAEQPQLQPATVPAVAPTPTPENPFPVIPPAPMQTFPAPVAFTPAPAAPVTQIPVSEPQPVQPPAEIPQPVQSQQ